MSRFALGGYSGWLLGFLAAAVFAFALFGLAGFRAIVSIVVLFVIPPFLFLKNTSLDAEEKIFFSLFIGLGLFSMFAWYVNQVLPSFRVSAVVAFGIAIATGIFAPKVSSLFRKPQEKQHSE